MSTSKNFDRICIVVIILALLFTVMFMNGRSLGIEATDNGIGYEDRLFDTSKVHTIAIVMDDWDEFIENCTSEVYYTCSAVIDGESYKNLAIRGKGNTSLSSVSSMGSERYSFKLEFDHYENGKSYHGLDKLSLNNLIYDNTYMKDYLSYRLMDEFGADAPLCSFVYITVNGEDWGLYLAVEGVEDSFLERNYDSEGELYKPDSLSFGGGGPGKGKDFNIEDFFKTDDDEETEDTESTEAPSGSSGSMPSFGGGSMPDFSGGSMPDFSGGSMPDFGGGSMPDFGGGSMPDFGGSMPEMPGSSGSSDSEDSQDGEKRGGFDFKGFDFNGAFGGMGSSDVKLQYIDDDPDSYSNIFSSAKTDISKADQKRLIQALKELSEGDIESSVDVDEVIRYFVVHNYVCNGDSYTGSMVHNYYVHEEDGQLSMIPWDYNLAFGTFQGSGSTGTVNDPIDSPLSTSGTGDRPMWDWIVSSEEYTQMYHEYFAEFLDTVDIQGIIDEAYQLIAPYVEKDPTAFCTYEEFETGVATLKTFCELRTESVRGQLDGSIPSTDEGQNADDSALVDASSITLSDMGSMGGNGGGFGGGKGGFGGFGGKSSSESSESTEGVESSGSDRPSMPEGFSMDDMPNMPEGFSMGNRPERSEGSSESDRPSMPGNFSQGDRPNMPGGFSQGDMPNMPDGFSSAGSSAISTENLILLGASILTIVIALVFIKIYKRKR